MGSRKTKHMFAGIAIVLTFVLITSTAAQAGVFKSAHGRRGTKNDSADVATKVIQTPDAARQLVRRTGTYVSTTTTTRPSRPKLVEVPCISWTGPVVVSGDAYRNAPTTCFVPESRARDPRLTPYIKKILDEMAPNKIRMTEVEVSSVEDLTNVPMPVPNPIMSAPSGVCGVEHQMDMRIPELIQVKPTQTPLGLLKAGAWGKFTVNWGDGTPPETFDFTGAPWPASTVQHVWQKRGTYNITVTATWNFDWQVDRFNGFVPALVTTGTIPNYQVREAQAVLVG